MNISIISVSLVVPIIFSQYQCDNMFIIFQEMEIINEGLWNNPFYSVMNQSERKKLCESLKTAVVFISSDFINDKEKLNYLLFLTKERSKDLFFEVSFVSYDKVGFIPSLACIFGQLEIHLIKNSNYDYYIITAKKDNISLPMLLGILSEPLSMIVIKYDALEQFKDIFKKKNPGSTSNVNSIEEQLDSDYRRNDRNVQSLNSLDESQKRLLCATVVLSFSRNPPIEREVTLLGTFITTPVKLYFHSFVIDPSATMLICNVYKIPFTFPSFTNFDYYHIFLSPTQQDYIFLLYSKRMPTLINKEIYDVDQIFVPDLNKN